MTPISAGNDFEGRVCLVTGAAGAIGSATAAAFARKGASLFLADRAPLDELLTMLAPFGRPTAFSDLDVTRAVDVRHCIDEVVRQFGRIDVLVNVAGVVSHGPAADLAEAEWDRVLAINLKGSFLACQAVIPIMRRLRYGRIVNLGSVVGLNGGNARPWLDPEEQTRAGNVAYGASKAGVHAMTAFLAKELAADGITVNAVAPGPVASDMTTELPEALRGLIPVGRMGTPAEIAEAILFLAAESSSFVTGAILDVNGGLKVG